VQFISTNVLGETLKNKFVNEFQQFAPQIASEILSLSLDGSCDCKNTVSLYVNLYEKQCTQFIENFVAENNLFSTVSDIVKALNGVINLSGKVAVTTISEWADFATKIQNGNYRSISTTLSGDNVIVFFA
jgi:hypothetical protein